MSSTTRKILTVVVVTVVAVASISYFYSQLPQNNSNQLPIKGVSMITIQEINQSIGGSWTTLISGEGGNTFTTNFLNLLGVFGYQNLTIANFTFAISSLESIIPAATDAGSTTFEENGTGSTLVGAYVYIKNVTLEQELYLNLSSIAKTNLTGYTNGTPSGSAYFMGWYNQTINGTLNRIFLEAGMDGNYLVLFTLDSTHLSSSVTNAGMLRILVDEFGTLPSSSIIYPPYMITTGQITSDMGLSLDTYGFMAFNVTNLGSIIENLDSLANNSLLSTLDNVSGYNLSLYLNSSSVGYLNYLSSISLVEGTNISTNLSIAVGSVGTLDLTSSLIWIGLNYEFTHNSNLSSNFTTKSINKTIFEITYIHENISFAVALDGGFIVFVYLAGPGLAGVSQTEIVSLVSSEESSLQ